MAQSKRAVEVCQQEFASLKSECALLQVQVAEKHKRITDLEVQRKKLLTDVDARKKNEVIIQDQCIFVLTVLSVSGKFTG